MKGLILGVVVVAALMLFSPGNAEAASAGPPLARVYCEWTNGSEVFTDVRTVEPREIHDARYRCENLFGGRVVGLEIVRD